jgi:lipoate-protein ligase B
MLSPQLRSDIAAPGCQARPTRAPSGAKLRLQRWGLTDYSAALQGQQQLWQALVQAEATVNQDGYLVITQHPRTITLGKSDQGEGLQRSPDDLQTQGYQIHRIERGGKSTVHNPGQWVVYPIVPLRAWRMSVKCFVNLLEKTMCNTCHAFGVAALSGSDNALPVGCWVDGRKLGQLGIQVSRGVTRHGLSFNVANDLKDFSWITPCGLPGIEVSSLSNECARAGLPIPTMLEVEQELLKQLTTLFGVALLCDRSM